MTKMTRVSKLKQKGDVEALAAILEDKHDWMLSLDAAEALVQLEDQRGLDYLINALTNPSADIRAVATEILEGLNHPRGNAALRSHQPDSDYPRSAGTSTNWAARLKNIKDALASANKRNVWSFGLEWIVASIASFFLSDIVFRILLHPLIFFEDIEGSLVTRPILAYVGSTWGDVFRIALLDPFWALSNYRVLVMSLTIEGILIGIAQWLVLRRYGIQLKAWPLAIACGWTLGFIVSQEFSWSMASKFIADIGPHWHQHIMLGYTLFGFFFGTLMGLSQTIVLPKVFRGRIVFWLALNMLTWTVAYFLSENILDGIFWAIVGYPISFHDGRYILRNTVVSVSELIIGGTITGIVLFRTSRQLQARR